MSGWHFATLVENRSVGPGLHRLTLEVPPVVRHRFHAPGQYHRIRIAGTEEATFALASPPHIEHFEYVVRATGGAAGAWAALPVGAAVEVSLPEGPGFPLHRARGKNLLLIGTGTGFAPLRSVIEVVRRYRSDFGQVRGAYGALSPAHLVFEGELREWAHEGLHITPTVTTPSATWSGAVGQVQALVPSFPLENTIAFLCGQPEMVSEVTSLLNARGISAGEIFLNLP